MLGTRLNPSCWALRLPYGLVPAVAGLDKFTNLVAARDVAMSIVAFTLAKLTEIRQRATQPGPERVRDLQAARAR